MQRMSKIYTQSTMDTTNLPKSHRIDADALEPIRKGSRFQLMPKILGRLEQLAKARFDVRQLGRNDMDEWRRLSAEACQTLAQSVNASSQIENEHIRVEELDLVLAAVTQPEDKVVTAELSERARAVMSIVETYLWALTLDKTEMLRLQQLAAEWNTNHARVFEQLTPALRTMHSEDDGFQERAQLAINLRLPPGLDCAGMTEKILELAGPDRKSTRLNSSH